MNPTFLIDVNVALAWLVLEHKHHDDARRWFGSLAAGEAGMCRAVQIGVLRLLGNRTVMLGAAMPAKEAWQRVTGLMEDERMVFCQEPTGLESIFGDLLRYPVPTNNLVNDAYLAAFAIQSNLTVATFDQGYRQFRGLRLQLLR